MHCQARSSSVCAKNRKKLSTPPVPELGCTRGRCLGGAWGDGGGKKENHTGMVYHM